METAILKPGITVGQEVGHGTNIFVPNMPQAEHRNVVIPDDTDYHGHPNYAKVLLSLLLLLSVSLTIGYVVSPTLAITLIFATAFWKIALVMRNFMHLKYEPLLVYIVVAAVALIIYAFFFGVYPDITAVPLDVTYPR
jgi:heme/copper-type cytochrome/quinol oxidase subunit 4